MLKLNKTKDKIPLIFTHPLHTRDVEINFEELIRSFYKGPCNMSDIPEYISKLEIKNSTYYDGWKYINNKTYRNLYFHKGTISYRYDYRYEGWKGDGQNHFLVVIYLDLKDDLIKAYVNQNYLAENPSHKTLINKFLKYYGINPRTDVTFVDNDNAFDIFKLKLEINMDDYDPNVQKEMSNNFKKYIKWRMPAMI